MNKGKLIGSIVAALVVIGVFVLAFKLISGAFSLVSGALDAVLGVVLILGLVIIVIWMFRYAAKKRK